MTADPAPAWLPFAIIAAFLVVFPLMWCLVTGLLSVMGGWQRLAQTFAAGNRPVTGQARHGLNGMVGWVSYRFVLTVHVAPDGFYLSVMPLFRFAHPPLFIPWTAIARRKPVQRVFWRAERFDIGHPVAAAITLPEGVLPLPGA